MNKNKLSFSILFWITRIFFLFLIVSTGNFLGAYLANFVSYKAGLDFSVSEISETAFSFEILLKQIFQCLLSASSSAIFSGLLSTFILNKSIKNSLARNFIFFAFIGFLIEFSGFELSFWVYEILKIPQHYAILLAALVGGCMTGLWQSQKITTRWIKPFWVIAWVLGMSWPLTLLAFLVHNFKSP